jgi:hypothetical protein
LDEEEFRVEVEKEAIDLLAIVTSPFITGALIQFLYPIVLFFIWLPSCGEQVC